MTTSSTTARQTVPPTPPIGDPPGVADRLRELGIVGLLVAVGLSVVGWLLVRGPDNDGSTAAAVGVLFMTAPVALARRWPLLSVGIVAAAAIGNGLVFGDMVRCGAAVPALLYITFLVGARSRTRGGSWVPPVVGLAVAFVSVFAQQVWDPALATGFLPLALPLVTVVWAAGVGFSALLDRRAAAAATG